MRLLVILVVLITSLELGFEVLPQLTFVVVLVPFGHSSVEESLEGKSTTEDGRNIDRVSLEQSRQLDVISIYVVVESQRSIKAHNVNRKTTFAQCKLFRISNGRKFSKISDGRP